MTTEPHRPPPITTLGTPLFTFSLDSFRITNTRARHEDTDYVSFTMQLKSATASTTPQTITKSIGNVNNGTHNVGLSFPNVHVDPSQTVVLNYIIVNSGHNSESDIDKALEATGGALAQKGLVTGGTALGTALLPGLGSILGALGGWLAGEISNLINANCDGPVAAEQVTLTYSDLLAKTAGGTFTHETPQPGTNSATGCGSNSMYYVDWHIAKTLTAPPIKTIPEEPVTVKA